MKKTVLVTAIGTVTATAIVRELKKTGEFHILGADINRQNEIATSLDVDEYYQFPYSVNEEYIPFALDFCKAHGVDYYYAVLDKEVVNVTAARDQFLTVGTKLCMVNHGFARTCHYKDQFGEWIGENCPDVLIKHYKSMEEAREAAFPLFMKPNEGVASTGCRKINSFEELKAGVKPEEIGTKVLVQDFVSGRNVTVDCVRNRKTGQSIQIARRELLRNSNGCGIAVEIFENEKLRETCDFLMEKLDLNGVCNMEFFETDSGYKIIEINPRFSAGTAYSCMAGVNTVLNAMRIADGERCEFGNPEIGAQFAERYEAYRMN